MGPRTMGSTAERSSARLTLALSSRNSGCSGVVWARHCSTSGRNRNCRRGREGSGLVASWSPLHPSTRPLDWGGSGLVASQAPLHHPPTPGLGRVRPGSFLGSSSAPTPLPYLPCLLAVLQVRQFPP